MFNNDKRVTIIVPIHNKEKYVLNTLKSIEKQKYKNINLILLMDNCTDNSESIIRGSIDSLNIRKYEIYYSKDNKYKKSGALNQLFFNRMNEIDDYIMILDADTVIDDDTITNGLNKLLSDDRLGAVCSKAGVTDFDGNNLWEKIVWSVQHIEYAQFDSHRIETEESIKVIHGMCAIFRKEALLEVLEARLSMNKPNNIYLEDNLVEDYELTIFLKMLNWKVSACIDMKAFTEVPLSVRELFIQRLRWLRGGVDTLTFHGYNKATYKDKLSNILFIVILFMKSIIFLSVMKYVLSNGLYLPNKSVMLVFILSYIDSLYRIRYIDKIYPIDIIIKIIYIPEIIYGWFQTFIMFISLIMSYMGVEQKW